MPADPGVAGNGAARLTSKELHAVQSPFALRTADGLSLAVAEWLPAHAKALVILVHGYAEHSGRYEYVMSSLISRGYSVVAHDHRGHGQSDGERALVRRFDSLIEDLHLVVTAGRERHPALPVFVVGHSMGGLVAARYGLRYGDELAGLVTSGAAFQYAQRISPPMVAVMRGMSKVFPRWPLPVGKEDTLSSDPSVAERFRADPLCYQGPRRMRTVSEMYNAGRDAIARASELRAPYLGMHGTDDRLISADGTRTFFEGASSPDKTLKLWPGMWHEIFQEVERDAVLTCMLDWLDQRR